MSDVRAAGKSANRKKNPIMQAKFANFWEADDVFLIYKTIRHMHGIRYI